MAQVCQKLAAVSVLVDASATGSGLAAESVQERDTQRPLGFQKVPEEGLEPPTRGS
jgi:hypothetical protein